MNRHRRRSLACYLNERLHREQQLENYDKSKWYQVNQACLPPSFSQRFTPWQMDEETQSFISNCYTKSDRFLANLFYSLLRTLLKLFLTSTSICGLLGCGRMHIFSRAQIEKFISDDDDHHRWIRDNGATLLDIGAGDGHITQKIAHFFDHVYATEASSFMVKRLKSRGYDILDIDTWHQTTNIPFTMVSCLNVLDRCEYPLDMLDQIHTQCMRTPNSRLLLAIVFPLTQYVEYNSDHKPKQWLQVAGSTFEHQASSFYTHVLQPAGFELIKWTKAPYLCEGNLDLTYYWLLDALYLLKPVPKQQVHHAKSSNVPSTNDHGSKFKSS